MALDSAQKRMSAISPACPWRGPLVDATESGFSATNRGAAAFLYGGLFTESGGGSSAAIGYFPHRHFAIRYFPDRYFPGTGGVAGITWFAEEQEVYLAGITAGASGVFLAGCGDDGATYLAGISNGAGEVIPR